MSAQLVTRVSLATGGFAGLDKEIEQFSIAQDWSASLDFKVRLVLEEIVLNALSYGGDENEATVTVTEEGSAIHLTIEDSGVAFNPLVDARSSDTTASIEERAIGGLGVHLVKTMADNIAYSRTDNKNILRIELSKE